jgi:hypothetical protein
MAVRRVWVSVEDRVDRRASFSGLRGIGGAGRLEVETGSAMSKGESRRLGGGARLDLGLVSWAGGRRCCCRCCCVGWGGC